MPSSPFGRQCPEMECLRGKSDCASLSATKAFFCEPMDGLTTANRHTTPCDFCGREIQKFTPARLNFCSQHARYYEAITLNNLLSNESNEPQ